MFYQIFVIKVPTNFPPGPRLKIPILGISLEEAYRLFLDQDELEKHKDYRKKYENKTNYIYSFTKKSSYLKKYE